MGSDIGTLPETNSLHLEMMVGIRLFPFGSGLFSWAFTVSFRVSIQMIGKRSRYICLIVYRFLEWESNYFSKIYRKRYGNL